MTNVWKSETPGAETTHTSLLVDHGRGYYVLNTTPGTGVIISGEAKKQ